jgi:hypothetical protein
MKPTYTNECFQVFITVSFEFQKTEILVYKNILKVDLVSKSSPSQRRW